MATFRQPDTYLPGPSRPSGVRAEAEAYAASLGQTRGTPGWGDAIRDYVRKIRSTAAKAATEVRGPWSPAPHFREDDPKPFDWGSLFAPALPSLFPPKGPPTRPAPGELEKRHFKTAPRPNDSAPMAMRIAEGLRRLPGERRKISEKDGVHLSASPILDRYYSTMLVKEDGLNPDGSFKIGSVVGPAQMKPSTAPDAARYAGLPFNRDRFLTDRVYNEMLGQAYYKWLVGQFGGDFVKAAAAYNWSPGKTKRAISAAERAGEPQNWERYVPRETREYVEFLRKFNHMTGD